MNQKLNIIRPIQFLICYLLSIHFSFSQPTFTVSSSSGNFSITCSNSVITLSATSDYSAPVTYTWITSSTTVTGASYTTAVPGTYSVYASSGTVSAAQSSVITIYQDVNSPTVTASTGTNNAISCLNPTVLLIGTVTPSNSILYWNEFGVGFGCNSATCVAGVPGTYTINAQNPVNGCTSTATIHISDIRFYPAFQTGAVFTVSCPNGTVNISPIITHSITTLSYLWESPLGAITTGTSSNTLNTNLAGAYTVTVTDTLSGCRFSSEILVYACVGLIENKLIAIEIFPNPVSDFLELKINNGHEQNGSLTIINTIGQVVKQEDINSRDKIVLDIQDFSNGVYSLQLANTNGIITRRFVISK